jgi:hypothetical protein
MTDTIAGSSDPATNRRTMTTNEVAPQADPLRVLAEWLIKLDDPGNENRRTVTLTQIISRAAAAIVAAEETHTPAARLRLAWKSARRRASLATRAFYAEADAARELEAAAVASPERVAEAIGTISGLSGQHGVAHSYDGSCALCKGDPQRITDALRAAGVFRAEAVAKAEALEEFAHGLDHIAGEWAIPSQVADIPETWDAHHLVVRGATQHAFLNAANKARATASRLRASAEARGVQAQAEADTREDV